MAKLFALLTGTADMCTAVPRDAWASVGALAPSFLLPGEAPLLLLKAADREYLFTDRGFLSLKSHDVASKRRHVRRTLWISGNISNVEVSTQDAVHMEVEVNFYIGSEGHCIHIAKSQADTAHKLFVALAEAQEAQARHAAALTRVGPALTAAATALSGRLGSGGTAAPEPGVLTGIASEALAWLEREQGARYIDGGVGAILARHLSCEAR